MARDKKQIEETPSPSIEAPSVALASSTTDEISIQGLPFTYSTPYVEGSVMTKGEANQLNQVRGENLRNNFASKIKALKTQIEKDRGEGAEFTEAELDAFKAEFAQYDASYVFSGVRIARGPVDPIRAKAKKMARETIEAALRGKGMKPSELAEGKMDELIDKYLESHPEVMDEAKAQVEKVKAAANEALGGVDLDSLKAPPVEEAPAASAQ